MLFRRRSALQQHLFQAVRANRLSYRHGVALLDVWVDGFWVGEWVRGWVTVGNVCPEGQNGACMDSA